MNPLEYDPTYSKNPKNIGDYIKKFRKEKGLLLREFAQQLGFGEFTLMKWKNGRVRLEQRINLIDGQTEYGISVQ
jgi:DNA-binding transcriptional regulator YiaG